MHRDGDKKDLLGHLVNPSGNAIAICGGVPQKLKIKCKCGRILNEQRWLKGYYNFSTQISHHGSNFPEYEFYFRISEKCPKCSRIICIYRPKRGVFFPLMLFVGSIIPDYYNLKENYDFSNRNILLSWCSIIEQIYKFNSERILEFFHEDIRKFINFIEQIPSLPTILRRYITKFEFYKLKN